MIQLAEAEEGIPIEPGELDADPFLLNVLNGTIDLRTGKLRAHDRTDKLSKLAPVEYDERADAPTFRAFLERVIPDEAIRQFLQRIIGYGLTGSIIEQVLFFLHGAGANGKSTLLGAIQTGLGDYARQAAPELLVSRGGDRHPTELADLMGARFVTSIEVDEGKRLAEALVKQMTGGDRLKARFMRTDFFEWSPTHKVFLAANHRPEIRGTDLAIWRRIHMIPFEVTIPEGERDPTLPARLLDELPGIMAWAVSGCLDWQRDGLGVPQAVRDATAAYRAEQDVLGDFLSAACVSDPQAWVISGSLYKTYTSWCESGGTKAITSTAFGRRLVERGCSANKQWVSGRQVRVWRGLRLLEEGETAQDRDTFADRDGLGREFRHNGADISYEGAIPENPSQPVPEHQPVPGNTQGGDCGEGSPDDELPWAEAGTSDDDLTPSWARA